MIKYFTEYRTQKNNIDITKIIGTQIEDLETLFKTIEAWRDIDNAEGIVLDEIGQQYGQLRKGMTDEVYRIAIQSKVLANNSKGDIYSIIDIVSAVLQLEPDEFNIEEAYLENPDMVGIVNITKVPIKALLASGMSTEEFVLLVKATLAAGIGLGELSLEGTFEFVKELESDMKLGFADVEMSTGGTLGAVFDGGDK